MEKKMWAGAFLITYIFFPAGWGGVPVFAGQRSFSSSPPAGRVLPSWPDFAKMPVSFIPNRGQLDERAAFYIQGKDKTVFFGAEGVTFALTNADESRWAVKLEFLGAEDGVKPAGMDKTGTVISYFKGEPGNWPTALLPYSRIMYANLWPGIDLVFTGTMDRLKYEFVVHPGADPKKIRLAYHGATSVQLNNKGSLVVSTPSGGFEDGMPAAYQDQAGKRVNVSLAYEILECREPRTDGGGFREDGGNAVVYGFSVGEYDRTTPLILDPVILVSCGFVGGPGYDYVYGSAADGLGRVYIAGYTYSAGNSFPTVAGPDLAFSGGSADAFVARLNASGTAFEYCGYIGGSGDDFGYGVSADPSGNAYVVGYTSSTEATFPVVKGPDLTFNGGGMDVFVAKVNPEGTALEYCGYIGGSGNDYGRSIAADRFGSAYITGYTSSTEESYPVAIGPGLTFNGGSADAFVAKVNPEGTALEYCGYVGGLGDDYGYGIAVDILGAAYITGGTTSTELSLPVSGGPDLTHNGLSDAIAAKVNPEGTALEYCGYIGGSGNDSGYGIAVDLSGSAYITGYTASTEDSFPVAWGPDLAYNGGVYDAFIAKLNAPGTGLEYCGYIGGSEYDSGTGIAVDGWGYAYVTGYTSSREDSFPVKEGPDLTHNGSFDAYAAKVDASGSGLEFCGYVGGIDADLGIGIALDADGSGNVYLTGNTYSTEYTFPAAAGPDLTHNGGRDGFVARIYENLIRVTSPDGYESWHVGFEQNITWLTTGTVENVKIEYSTDNGTTWMEIVDSIKNEGTYTWAVPDSASEECLIRVSDAEDGDPSDTSNAVFTITNAPVIYVTSPNGGETWTVGSSQDITWITGGTVGNVKLEYTTDGGLTYLEIEASIENSWTYTWVVPDAVSDQCLVRISEAEDGDPSDASNGLFSIAAATSSPATKRENPNPIKGSSEAIRLGQRSRVKNNSGGPGPGN